MKFDRETFVWGTADHRRLRLSEMTDEHLAHTVRYVLRKLDRALQGEYVGYAYKSPDEVIDYLRATVSVLRNEIDAREIDAGRIAEQDSETIRWWLKINDAHLDDWKALDEAQRARVRASRRNVIQVEDRTDRVSAAKLLEIN